MKLTPKQQIAFNTIVECIENNTPVLLTGFAGTGKSTTIATVIKSLSHKLITIATPTHKAAAVLSAMLETNGIVSPNVKVTTIHKALGKRPQRQGGGTMTFSRPTKEIYGILIIDECSMIDAELFQDINEAAPSASIVYVGDPAQLPPTSGNGLLSPVFSAIEQRAHLSDIIRQGEDNPIIELSAALRRVMAASAHITVSDVVEMVNEYDKDGVKIGMIQKHEIADYCSDALKNGLDCRYLAYKNESIDKQTVSIRSMLHGRDVQSFVIGEPVSSLTGIQNVINNNHEGVITAIGEPVLIQGIACLSVTLDDNLTVNAAIDIKQKKNKEIGFFRMFEKLKAQSSLTTDFKEKANLLEQATEASAQGYMIKDSIAELRPCVASTVHKAQGSTFDVAVVDVADILTMRNRSEALQCLYVAVTRPKTYLILVV
jgi:exodeoxyribonuclease-5